MILFIFNYPAQSQGRKGFEMYYYPAVQHMLPALSSKIFYQASNSWYAELRYNYEEEKAVACSVGKTFSKESAISYSFTPTVGLLAGKLQGVTIGLNTALAYKGITFSSALQHASCFEKKAADFLFSWSELGYQITKQFSAALVLQQTCVYNAEGNWEPGIQLSISFAGWTFPLYLFKPAGSPGYFVAGVSHEWKTR